MPTTTAANSGSSQRNFRRNGGKMSNGGRSSRVAPSFQATWRFQLCRALSAITYTERAPVTVVFQLVELRKTFRTIANPSFAAKTNVVRAMSALLSLDFNSCLQKGDANLLLRSQPRITQSPQSRSCKSEEIRNVNFLDYSFDPETVTSLRYTTNHRRRRSCSPGPASTLWFRD